MKYVMIVGDGMADMPIGELNMKTPLEAVDTPAFDMIARGGMGRARTCPEGMSPGSDSAFLSIFGNNPADVFTGRSPLEAAGLGINLRLGEVSYRVNIIAIDGAWQSARITSHNGNGVDGNAAYALINAVISDPECARMMHALGLTIHPTHSFRHIAVLNGPRLPELDPPHDILGENVNDHLPSGLLSDFLARAQVVLGDKYALWPWGSGYATILPDFFEKYGKRGCAITAVPLVRGIARLSGVDAPKLKGATGLIDTDYEGKLNCALAALKNGCDFALIHVEAPDEISHAGDLSGKLEAIRRIDRCITAKILKRLPEIDRDFRVMLLSDHYTRLDTRTHDGTPIPYAIYDSSAQPPQSAIFCERAAENAQVIEGRYLLDRLFN